MHGFLRTFERGCFIGVSEAAKHNNPSSPPGVSANPESTTLWCFGLPCTEIALGPVLLAVTPRAQVICLIDQAALLSSLGGEGVTPHHDRSLAVL